MSRFRFLVSAALAAFIAAGFGVGTAHGDAPTVGDSCTALHATIQDANGRTMWCNPTMTGNHNLVWQYGGPAD
ncbi:hypothetical protein [Mycobacterium montefiorense]|uniref:Secreted protein n=1 Tax=Mycobacterium montefiorense TaxID=154654 RepID=A0AA37PVC8_9MYCO|nr:hypothetical protein [Mycobacterium montefiorense]GBG39452.1 hypothetical protein MmonteBS_38240 [Mycobacterium montefiorense]GKU36036.1 hypothetical protein NJB14191_33820 [Mycobacterium montefiorense]GKU41106.1 hypothetical protein NJB14192_30910 [Mycobacterium montefiorense]GKU44135.1 hypothetical protein NJB14194_07660 [Mycobacterium montefiorense]GKU52451.1 hypothetical protein NJB14195_36940 [Mycobacterium montefiorense]